MPPAKTRQQPQRAAKSAHTIPWQIDNRNATPANRNKRTTATTQTKSTVTKNDKQTQPTSILRRINYDNINQLHDINANPSNVRNNATIISHQEIATTPAGRISRRRVSIVYHHSDSNEQHANDLNDLTMTNATTQESADDNLNEFHALANAFQYYLDGVQQDYESFCQNNFEQSNLAECTMRLTKLRNRQKRLTDVYEQLIGSGETWAWKKWCDIYDNDYLAVRAHIQDILNINDLQQATGDNIRYALDTVTNALRQLSSLNANVTELIIIQLMEAKLDNESRKDWEMYRDPKNIPTFDEFSVFLDKRARILTTQSFHAVVKQPKADVRSHPYNKPFQGRKMRVCRLCQADHGLFKCSLFLKMPLHARLNKVKELQLCYGCLNKHDSSFPVARCPNRIPCPRCKTSIHNSVLCSKNPANYSQQPSVQTVLAIEPSNEATTEAVMGVPEINGAPTASSIE